MNGCAVCYAVIIAHLIRVLNENVVVSLTRVKSVVCTNCKWHERGADGLSNQLKLMKRFRGTAAAGAWRGAASATLSGAPAHTPTLVANNWNIRALRHKHAPINFNCNNIYEHIYVDTYIFRTFNSQHRLVPI